MDSVLNWGIEVVLWFQQFSPALDIPFKVLTFLGDKVFYMLLMPMMYWCINRRVGRGQVVRAVVVFSLPERNRQVARRPTTTV